MTATSPCVFFSIRHVSRVLLLLGLGLTLPVDASPCPDAVPLGPSETWRDAGGAPGDVACFAVELDEPGTVALELSAALDAPGVRFEVLLPEHDGASRTMLRQAAAFVAFDAPPGRHLVRVLAEDPRAALPPFRLAVRFVAAASTKGELDSEIEVEPDPLHIGPVEQGLHDLAVLPESLRSNADALCRRDEKDDHAGGVACATPLALGHRVRGQLGNAWGDDVDVFRVQLDELSTVEIVARGEAELAVELADRSGQRLALGTGQAGEARLVRTLVPGTYFVAIEGLDRREGGYSLGVIEVVP